MNRHFFSFVIMTALFAAVHSSCDELVPTGEDPIGQIVVNLNAGIKPVSTYAENDQWETSDEVGLFMKRTGYSLSTFEALYFDARNRQMNIVGQSLTTSPPLMYPTSGNVDFIAYYPYNNSATYDLSILVNIAGQAAGLPEEILYSNNITNQAPTDTAVTLNFKYSLAKIELIVTGGVNSDLDSTDFSNITVTVEDLYTQATLQLSDGTFTDFQDKQPVTLYKKSVNDTSAIFEALVLPMNEEITFLFNVGGSVYSHKITVNYASETLYRYDFALDFPYFPERKATLLNAVIIPRNITPQQNISINASKQMIITTDSSEVRFEIAGQGKMTIDWGDGTSETYTLVEYNYMMQNHGYYSYIYSSTSTHTITITSENITFFQANFPTQLKSLDVSNNTSLSRLQCLWNPLTSLDVSNCTALKAIRCGGNQLTSLDVSDCAALTFLMCDFNQLTTNELNALFETLHNNVVSLESPESEMLFSKTIIITGNPGANDCNKSIAEDKGWIVQN